jgi:flagellar biosynthetic protein FlhB
MAGGDDQEKTEDPTPKKREEARKEGRVPRSQELTTAVLLVGGTAALVHAGAGAMARESVEVLHASAAWLRADPLTIEGASAILRQSAWAVMLALLPFAGIVAGLIVAVGAAQGRGITKGDAFVPKFEHIDPSKGIKRIVGTQGLFQGLKALLKFALLGFVIYKTVGAALPQMVALTGAPETEIVDTVRALSWKLALTSGLAYLVITLADYGFEVFQYEKGLRMTKQEIIDEHKQTEGNPMVKHRMRALGQAMIRKRMLADVPKADVVVTNPTHIAIALKYDPTSNAAPVVVAMGERKLAEKIKAIAAASGVPMVENKPLARALLATADVGRPIPTELFTAVAEVLAFVYRRRATAGRGLPPARGRS